MRSMSELFNSAVVVAFKLEKDWMGLDIYICHIVIQGKKYDISTTKNYD